MRRVSRPPTFPGRQAGAALRMQKLGGGGSSAAMAAAAASENEDEGTRLQKAAAWQWFMHGAGADAHAPRVEASAARRAMKTLASRQTSRFAQEATYLSRTSKLPLFDDVELPGIAAFVAQPQHPYVRRSRQRAPSSSEKRAQRRVEKKTQLPFIGFQRLLQKLILPKSSSSEFLSRPSPAIASESEEEAQRQHHYHSYTHYHHHHHFYPDKPGSPIEEVAVVTEQPHGGVSCSRRRRYSESALCYEPLQEYLYHESARRLQSATESCRWQASHRTCAMAQPAHFIWE